MNRRINICFQILVVCLLIDLVAVGQSTNSDNLRPLIDRYNSGHRDVGLIDSLIKELWFEEKYEALLRDVSSDYVASFNVNESMDESRYQVLSFISLVSNSKDRGFDLPIINQKFQSLYQLYIDGKRSLTVLKNLAAVSKLLGKKNLYRDVSRAYINSLNPNLMFQKSNLSFVIDFTERSSDKSFLVLISNMKAIKDEKLKEAAEVKLGDIIYKEEISSFAGINDDNVTPDWVEIEKRVVKKYNELGEEKVWSSKMIKSWQLKTWDQFVIAFAQYYDKYPNKFKNNRYQNNMCWHIFETVANKEILKIALKAQKVVVGREPNFAPWLDTYANLLYKIGRRRDAIVYEKRALKLDSLNTTYQNTLKKMYLHEPTWPSSNSKVKFDQALDMASVLLKAKLTQKYIMLDFMATWCGPCKEMEKYVYGDKRVGELINKNFIPVKIQVDKTNSDSDYIKSWHVDADKLMRQYNVTGYPTVVFLSPEGKVLKKVVGQVDTSTFLKQVNSVLANSN